MEGWQRRALGDIARVGAGNSAPQEKTLFADGTVPFFRTSDVGRIHFGEIAAAADALNEEGARGLKRFPKGTILFPKSGASTFLNHRVMMTVEGCVASHLATISAIQDRVLNRFLLYFLATVQAQDLVQDQGYPSLNLPLIAGISVSLPSLPEQRRIVAILDEAFDAIATAKANTEKNLHSAHKAFSLNLTRTLRNRVDGWVETTIGAVCILRSGTTVPRGIERDSGDIPYVKVAEMTMTENMNGITTSTRFIDRADLNTAWVIPSGAVIFPKRGGAILTNKKRLALVDMCADLNIMSVIPSDRITPEFLYLYFLTVDMRKLGTGSSIPQINNYDISPLRISFPASKHIQQELTAKLIEIKEKTEILATLYDTKLAALDKLKKSLLHQAFTGQLTAKAADRQLEAVA